VGLAEPVRKSRDEIAAAYSSPPWWYDLRGFLILTFAYNSTLGRQLRLFAPNFGERHLEIACGTGTLLELVLKRRLRLSLPPTHVVGIDYAESMLAGAIHRFRAQTSVELELADAGALPFDDESFHTANIANSVHCLPEVDAALAEAYRVLKPGGTVAANVLLYPRTVWPLRSIAGAINRWGVAKGILQTPFERSDVRRRFERAGFQITAEAVFGNCYEICARKPGSS
jgi:ubiquinone/menaquinone biosynthesis C-methylase UbiE